jgi:hypothetical protein
MPNERISMLKLKQLIGLQASNLSVRALSRAVGLSIGAVSKSLRAVRACGIEAAEAQSLSEAELERRVFGAAPAAKPGALVAPDCAWIHGELKRHRHVTVQLLWEEYAGRYGAAAYRRSAFCQSYRRWQKRRIPREWPADHRNLDRDVNPDTCRAVTATIWPFMSSVFAADFPLRRKGGRSAE